MGWREGCSSELFFYFLSCEVVGRWDPLFEVAGVGWCGCRVYEKSF